MPKAKKIALHDYEEDPRWRELEPIELRRAEIVRKVLIEILDTDSEFYEAATGPLGSSLLDEMAGIFRHSAKIDYLRRVVDHYQEVLGWMAEIENEYE